MATKAEIQAQINTIDDGGTNTAGEVRSVFGTHASSLLESVYSTAATETHSINSITIPVTANLEYEVEIMKVGRRVTLFLNVVNASAGFLAGIPFKITNVTGNQYLAATAQVINYQLFDSAGNSVNATITATATETNILIDAIPNTSFKGVITYNAVN